MCEIGPGATQGKEGTQPGVPRLCGVWASPCFLCQLLGSQQMCGLPQMASWQETRVAIVATTSGPEEVRSLQWPSVPVAWYQPAWSTLTGSFLSWAQTPRPSWVTGDRMDEAGVGMGHVAVSLKDQCHRVGVPRR